MGAKSDTAVLPRPVQALPDYANARARTNATEKLRSLFGLTPVAAQTISDACVDPAELRKAAEAPERIPVPGGTILGIRTEAWARKVLPDPRNPRIGPARRHPFAVDPGTDEDSRFRPAPDPASNGRKPELVVKIESREHLTWAMDQTKKYILAENDWRASIRSQGVMTEVWVTAATYKHLDGSSDICVITTAEGSSRMTAVHDILGERSVDLGYDVADRQMRARIRKLNEALARGPSPDDSMELRCEIVPVLFLVGFEPYLGGTAEFATAVKSLVALRHVDPPKPWGEGPEMEALADAVLDEFERRGIVTPDRRSWLAGSITRAEAVQAHLSENPSVRAAAIIELFTSEEPRIMDALRVAISAQSTRKRITGTLRNQLATALIVRSLPMDGVHADRVRRYMRHGFGKALRNGEWTATTRGVDDLLKEAVSELEARQETGPSSLELAARAAYPLIGSLKLWADRGTANNQQPDRRAPGEVIDAMRRTRVGLHQLAQALRDHEQGRSIRAVDGKGEVVLSDDGAQELHVNDMYLRTTYPPPGSLRPPAATKTATERLQAALSEFGAAVRGVDRALNAVRKVQGADGTPLVETDGVDPRHGEAWRKVLEEGRDELIGWARLFSRRHRESTPETDDGQLEEEEEDLDEMVAEWDADEDAAAAS